MLHLGIQIFLQLQEDIATHTMPPKNTLLFWSACYYRNKLTREKLKQSVSDHYTWEITQSHLH